MIHGRTKTLMRHCAIGHRRGAFKDKSYRDRVSAVLNSVYGSTFTTGSYWYHNPDADLFFSKVFSMAAGYTEEIVVTPTDTGSVFVKNGDTKKIDICEVSLRKLGVSLEEVKALYERTPAAAWKGGCEKSELAIEVSEVGSIDNSSIRQLTPLAAAPRPKPRKSSVTESSVSGASGSARWEHPSTHTMRSNDEDVEMDSDEDDDATVVADEFNDEVEAFLEDGSSDDALPALPAGLGDDVIHKIPVDSLDFLPSQPLGDGCGDPDFFKSFGWKDVSDSPVKRNTCAETLNAHTNVDTVNGNSFEKLFTLGAVRKNMSLLGATAATSVVSDQKRIELELHLAAVDKILREQTDLSNLPLFCSQ